MSADTLAQPPGDVDVKARMHAALEAQALLPDEPPRLPTESRLPQTTRPEAPTDRSAAHGAGQAAKSHGQSSLSKAKDEALRHAQGDPEGAGNSAAGVARSNAAKEKAKHVHKPPGHP